MKKNLMLSIVVVLLILGMGITPITDGLTITKTFEKPYVDHRDNFVKNRVQTLLDSSNSKSDENPWTPEDEGDHFPCGTECWFYHAALTLENGQQWDAGVTFIYAMNRTKKGYSNGLSGIRIKHLDRQTGRYYDYIQIDEFPGPFHTEKNGVNLTYHNSSAWGLYPNYHWYSEDDQNNIVTDLHFHAISSPCFVLQESTNGIVPWFFAGTGRYYFIPVLEVIGNITINGATYNVTGVAYYEHSFAHNNFHNPFKSQSLKEFLTGTKLMLSIAKWRFSQVIKNRPKRSLSFHRSNDYLLGWCWGWIVFDNGCSIAFWRPTILKKSEGRVPVFLYFSKDGKNYSEIGCVYWKNNRVKYIERADIYVPVDYEITAYKDDIKLHITFNATTELTEVYGGDFAVPSKLVERYSTFYCCGNVEGYYADKEGSISLEGFGALEQSRLLRKFIRHRSLDIDFLLPPYGLGISIRRVSHRLGIERIFELQLRPTFEFISYIKPVPDT